MSLAKNNNPFAFWKINQLKNVNLFFTLLFTFVHSLHLVKDLNFILEPNFLIILTMVLLRLFPLILFVFGYIISLYKKIVFIHINNLAMLSTIYSSICITLLIPSIPTNNFLLVDSIAAIMATIFSVPWLSIIDFVICLLTVFLSKLIIPFKIMEILEELILLGLFSMVISISVNNCFYKTYGHINKINSMATEDNLTGLYNRNILKENVYDKLTECCIYDGSMIMIDIDHFKNINDTFGHQTGDIALCKLAGILNENVRKEDYVVRFGGEEFLIILKDLSKEEAISIAKRIHSQIKLITFEPTFTVSCGVSSFKKGDTFKAATKMVDDKLYEAKNTGRNRICF